MNMISKNKLVAFLFVTSFGFLSAMNSQSMAAEFGLRNDNTGCIGDLKRVRKTKGWFAIAVTRSIGNAQGCGIVSGAASAGVARNAALQGCKTNVKYPIFEGNTGCRVTGIAKRK
jgi:hypothetical protein